MQRFYANLLGARPGLARAMPKAERAGRGEGVAAVNDSKRGHDAGRKPFAE